MHDDPVLRALIGGSVFQCKNADEMSEIFEYMFDHELPVGPITAGHAKTGIQWLFKNYPVIAYERAMKVIVCEGFVYSGSNVLYYDDFIELVGHCEINLDLGGLMDAVFG